MAYQNKNIRSFCEETGTLVPKFLIKTFEKKTTSKEIRQTRIVLTALVFVFLPLCYIRIDSEKGMHPLVHNKRLQEIWGGWAEAERR
jgi:hypothetical protein